MHTAADVRTGLYDSSDDIVTLVPCSIIIEDVVVTIGENVSRTSVVFVYTVTAAVVDVKTVVLRDIVKEAVVPVVRIAPDTVAAAVVV